MATPIIYVIALVIAVIGTLIASSGSKGKVTVSNRTYEEGGSFELTAQRDDFINQTVTKVRVSSQSSSGGQKQHSQGQQWQKPWWRWTPVQPQKPFSYHFPEGFFIR